MIYNHIDSLIRSQFGRGDLCKPDDVTDDDDSLDDDVYTQERSRYPNLLAVHLPFPQNLMRSSFNVVETISTRSQMVR